MERGAELGLCSHHAFKLLPLQLHSRIQMGNPCRNVISFPLERLAPAIAGPVCCTTRLSAPASCIRSGIADIGTKTLHRRPGNATLKKRTTTATLSVADQLCYCSREWDGDRMYAMWALLLLLVLSNLKML
jgi:hypothetical protein